MEADRHQSEPSAAEEERSLESVVEIPQDTAHEHIQPDARMATAAGIAEVIKKCPYWREQAEIDREGTEQAIGGVVLSVSRLDALMQNLQPRIAAATAAQGRKPIHEASPKPSAVKTLDESAAAAVISPVVEAMHVADRDSVIDDHRPQLPPPEVLTHSAVYDERLPAAIVHLPAETKTVPAASDISLPEAIVVMERDHPDENVTIDSAATEPSAIITVHHKAEIANSIAGIVVATGPLEAPDQMPITSSLVEEKPRVIPDELTSVIIMQQEQASEVVLTDPAEVDYVPSVQAQQLLRTETEVLPSILENFEPDMSALEQLEQTERVERFEIEYASEVSNDEPFVLNGIQPISIDVPESLDVEAAVEAPAMVTDIESDAVDGEAVISIVEMIEDYEPELIAVQDLHLQLKELFASELEPDDEMPVVAQTEVFSEISDNFIIPVWPQEAPAEIAVRTVELLDDIKKGLETAGPEPYEAMSLDMITSEIIEKLSVPDETETNIIQDIDTKTFHSEIDVTAVAVAAAAVLDSWPDTESADIGTVGAGREDTVDVQSLEVLSEKLLVLVHSLGIEEPEKALRYFIAEHGVEGLNDLKRSLVMISRYDEGDRKEIVHSSTAMVSGADDQSRLRRVGNLLLKMIIPANGDVVIWAYA